MVLKLDKAEEKISKRKAKILFDSGKIDKIKVGTYAGLAQIHKFLFGEIYDFAGKNDYLTAMERSPVKDIEIKLLLKNALTKKINERDIFIKGIDASYNYEGYNEFKTDEL